MKRIKVETVPLTTHGKVHLKNLKSVYKKHTISIIMNIHTYIHTCKPTSFLHLRVSSIYLAHRQQNISW